MRKKKVYALATASCLSAVNGRDEIKKLDIFFNNVLASYYSLWAEIYITKISTLFSLGKV